MLLLLGGWTSSKQENCVTVDTNRSVSFPIDGGTRTLKNRSGIHLFCQKENLPAGVAYKNLAILSCAAVFRAADTSKSKSSEAEESSWDSKTTTMVNIALRFYSFL